MAERVTSGYRKLYIVMRHLGSDLVPLAPPPPPGRAAVYSRLVSTPPDEEEEHEQERNMEI